MPHGQENQNRKQKQYCNKFNKRPQKKKKKKGSTPHQKQSLKNERPHTHTHYGVSQSKVTERESMAGAREVIL